MSGLQTTQTPQMSSGEVGAAPAAPSRLWTPEYRTLLAIQATFGFGLSVFILLPKYLAAELHAPASSIGLIMAAVGLASVAVVPVLGRFVRLVGRRNALVLSNVLVAAAAVAFAFTTRAGPLAVTARALQGVAFSLSFAAGMAIIAEIAPPAQLGQAIGLFGSANLAMNAIAPAVAEPLAASLGFRAVFLVAAAAALVGALVAIRLPRHPSTPAPSGSAPAPGAGSPSASAVSAAAGGDPHALRRLIAVTGMTGAGMGVLFSFIAPFALERHVEYVRSFFVTYTLAALTVRVFGGRLTDVLGHRRIATLSIALYGVAIAMTGIVGPGPLITLGLLVGVAHGATYPSLMALIVTTSSVERRERALAFANGAMSLGAAFVLPIGYVAERWGYPVVFVAAGIVTSASAALIRKRS